MEGGGGFIPGGFDPTRKPEGAKAIVRDRLERGRRLRRMGRWERRLFVAIAAVVALGALVGVALSAVV